MNIVSLLPMIGGIVPLVIALKFMKEKGLKEPSQQYFFFSMICLAIFGIFESLAYISSSRDAAYVLLVLSKTAAILFPFFMVSFAAYLKDGPRIPIILAIPSIIVAILSIFFIPADVHPESWGWSMSVNDAFYLPIYGYGLFLFILGMILMFSLTKEMKKANSPRYKNMAWITYGFAGYFLVTLASNLIVVQLDLDIFTPLSTVQVFPCILLAWGFLRDKVKKEA